MSYSIRQQTTWAVVASISVLTTLFCVANYWVNRAILVHNFDEDLLLEFQSISSVARIWPDGDFYIDLDFDVATQYNTGGSRYFQAWDSELTDVIDRSPFIESTDSQWPLPTPTVTSEPVFSNMTVDEKSVRVVIQTIDAQWGWAEQEPDLEVADDIQDFSLVLMVGRDRDSLNNALFELGVWTALIGLTLVALSWAIVNHLVTRGMKTFALMSNKIEKIATTEESIPVDDWPDEIQPVVTTLNQLLARIDASVQRMRRFTADAAHELRTPLAELRLVTDVALRTPDNNERIRDAVQQANQLSHSMANMVNAMLHLARFQSGRHHSPRTDVSIDMRQFIQTVLDQHMPLLSQRNQRVLFESARPLTRMLDADLCHIIFSNLISNATAYAPEGTTVRIALASTENGFVFTLENKVENIEPDDLEHFTQPFWRKGESRHQRDHVGLGLALVSEASQLMNLSLRFSLTDAHTLRCTLIQ